MTVTPATPTITTSQQPATRVVGSSISDTATVTGLVTASSGNGDLQAVQFGHDAEQQHAAVHQPSRSLSGSTATATSAGYTTSATGTDYWVATYSGDSNNNTATSGKPPSR